MKECDAINWEKYQHIEWMKYKERLTKIPVNDIDASEKGIEEFNRIYDYISQKTKRYRKTKCGGICIQACYYRIPCWNVNVTTSSVTLIYIKFGYCARWRIKFGYKANERSALYKELVCEIEQDFLREASERPRLQYYYYCPLL